MPSPRASAPRDGPQGEHQAVADRALEATLQRAGADPRGSSSVRRSAEGLHVTLFVPEETEAGTRAMAAVRVAGALRAFDPSVPRIDIGCEVAR